MARQKMRRRPFVIAALAAASIGAAGYHGQHVLTQLLPPSNKLGECYAQVFVPPVFKTEMTRELIKESTEQIEKVPAKYDFIEQTIMVKEPSERLEIIPATYEWVEEKVLIQPETERIEIVPPVYETIQERMVETPAHSVWKKGAGPFQRMDHATGDIVCLVEVPPTYTTLEKRILKTPATTRTVKIPAQYRIVKKRVLRTPAKTQTVKVPGEYDTLKVKKMVAPAYLKRAAIPAQYQEVSKQVKVRNGKIEWRPVLCQTNVTPGIIHSLQTALQAANFDPGPVDGVLGRQTLAAVESYQQAKGLPVGNLTLETLESLGLPIGDLPAPTKAPSVAPFPVRNEPIRPIPTPLTPSLAPQMDSLNMNDPHKPQMDSFNMNDQPERIDDVNMPDIQENPNTPQDVNEP